jgi:hypothetical protein
MRWEPPPSGDQASLIGRNLLCHMEQSRFARLASLARRFYLIGICSSAAPIGGSSKPECRGHPERRTSLDRSSGRYGSSTFSPYDPCLVHAILGIRSPVGTLARHGLPGPHGPRPVCAGRTAQALIHTPVRRPPGHRRSRRCDSRSMIREWTRSRPDRVVWRHVPHVVTSLSNSRAASWSHSCRECA